MSEDVELDYDYLMHKALRGLMREVIEMVAEIGDAPGAHHFYIEFLTRAPGVSIPEHLLNDYPERMTIVLQHQFENLTVDEDGFAVTLWFKGKESRLVIPFLAVASFADPSAQFGLRFEPAGDQTPALSQPPAAEAAAKNSDEQKAAEDKKANEEEKGENDGADVVSLDAFRKK